MIQFDDYLDTEVSDKLESMFLDTHFPWFKQRATVANTIEMQKEWDNFLPKEQQDFVESIIDENQIQWYMCEDKTGTMPFHYMKKDGDKNTAEYYQFVHMFMDNNEIISPWFEAVEPILAAIEEKTGEKVQQIFRIKANLQPMAPWMSDDAYNTPHIDVVDREHKVLLYYVCDSDGDTRMLNKLGSNQYKTTHRVSPKKGRAILFDGGWHAGRHPKHHPYRIVVNVDFI